VRTEEDINGAGHVKFGMLIDLETYLEIPCGVFL